MMMKAKVLGRLKAELSNSGRQKAQSNTLNIIAIIIIIIDTRPRPAFGRLGLGGSSGGYTYHG